MLEVSKEPLAIGSEVISLIAYLTSASAPGGSRACTSSDGLVPAQGVAGFSEKVEIRICSELGFIEDFCLQDMFHSTAIDLQRRRLWANTLPICKVFKYL